MHWYYSSVVENDSCKPIDTLIYGVTSYRSWPLRSQGSKFLKAHICMRAPDQPWYRSQSTSFVYVSDLYKIQADCFLAFWQFQLLRSHSSPWDDRKRVCNSSTPKSSVKSGYQRIVFFDTPSKLVQPIISYTLNFLGCVQAHHLFHYSPGVEPKTGIYIDNSLCTQWLGVNHS